MEDRIARPITILVIVQFLVMVGFGIIIPILPFLIGQLGGGAIALGIFMSAYSVMQFFFAPFWGRLSDRIGRRPVILIGLSGFGLTFLLFGLAHNLYLLIFVRALSGIVSSAALPTSMAYIADITKGADRSKSMGMVGAAMGLGMVFGPAIGGWLGYYSFTLPFYVAGVLALLVLPFAWKMLPETLEKGEETIQQKPARLSFQVVKDPLFTLLGYNFIVNFAMAMFQTTYTLLVVTKVGFGAREIGLIFTVIGITGVVVQGMLIGRLVKRFGDGPLIKYGALIGAAGMALIAVAYTPFGLVAATVLFMIGNSLIGPSSTSLVTHRSAHGSGTSLGLFQSFGSLGRIFGPVFGGVIYGLNINSPYILNVLLLSVIFLTANRLKEVLHAQT